MTTQPPIPGASDVAPDLSARIHDLLKSRFGLSQLRDGQEDVIKRVLAGQNALAIMPTGAGKSLCYQLPALMLEGRTVVVSPLIALMKDQCEALRERGVEAVQVNSALDAAESQQSRNAIADGSARIILTTPERLSDPDFIAVLQESPVSLLVVDEAHCISQWGHDFRPAFLEIAPAVKALGRPTVLALTATATDTVTKDIIGQLGIARGGVLNTGAYRPNLRYSVEQVAREQDKLERILALVKSFPGSGIVYAATVKSAEAVHDALAGANESVRLYHGKLKADDRRTAQDAFMDGKVRVMVATNAFGLGIDKPDIRFVLHYQMPAGLDAYYQESGRAGRDAFDADCTLLFLRSDKSVQQFFMGGRYPGMADVEALYRALLAEPPGDATGWSIADLQRKLDRPINKLKVAASLLRRQRIVGARASGELFVRKNALDDATLAELVQAYQDKREQDRAALEAMVAYAQSGQCRWHVLLDHLQAESGPLHCGNCDNCRHIAALEAEIAANNAGLAVLKGSGEPSVIEAAEGRGGADRQRGPASEAVARKGSISGGQAIDMPLGSSAARSRFQPGEQVRVKRYGVGTVIKTDALSVTVEFEAGQQRSFQADYVQRVRSRRLARAVADATAAFPETARPTLANP